MSSTKFFGEMDTVSEKTADNVNHPKHYTTGDIECIDAIKASMSSDSFVGYAGYLKGNVLKYIWRYQLKKKPVEDLEKAKWYLEKLIEVTKKEGSDA